MGWLRTLLLLTSLLAGQAASAELRVALGDRSTLPDGSPDEVAALNEDLARALCQRMNARCTFTRKPLGEIIPGVEGGSIDLGFGNFLRSAERERQVAFSDPLWHSSSRLLAKRAVAAAFPADRPGPDELRRARVAAVDGSRQHTYLTDVAGARELTVLGATTPAATLALLAEGRADFALLPVLSAYVALRHSDGKGLEFFGPPSARNGLGGSVHAVLPKRNPTLQREVNRALAALRADGSYQRMVRQHLPFGLD